MAPLASLKDIAYIIPAAVQTGPERFSTVAETKVYHVTAMGIRFTETNEQKP